MLLLFLDSGLRRAEMASLKLQDLRLDARRVTVKGKGDKVGVAPFCSKTAKAIWFYLVERESRAVCNYLWVTEEGRAFSIDGRRLHRKASRNNTEKEGGQKQDITSKKGL